MPRLKDPADITVFAKSPWSPSIRREHAWARQAAVRDLRVRFLERPLHARNGGLGVLGRPVREITPEGVETVRSSTVVPGHRARWAEVTEAAVLRQAAGRRVGVSVVNLPWHWEASRGARRRVLDLADDWAALQPDRAARIGELYRRIADQADEIVLVNEGLRGLFPGRSPVVVANCASRDLLDRGLTMPLGKRRMAYLGTVTERVDHELLAAVLEVLPDWSLDVIGPFSFAGRGSEPDAAFAAFLNRFGDRVRCHGPIGREHVGPLLDAVDVLVIPNRAEQSRGQDSMKLYDYAAHGRPIVSTLAMPAEDPCPHVLVAPTAYEFADAVTAVDPAQHMAERRAWAARNTWEARAPQWLGAVLGRAVAPATLRDGR